MITSGRDGITIDVRQYQAEIDRFIDQMKRTCDKDKYKTITNYMFIASDSMEKTAKALVQNRRNRTHKHTTKQGVTYTFKPGSLKKAIKRRKLAMNKGKGNPAIRISSLSKNPALSAYYGGMVNVGHTAGKKAIRIEGQGFYEKAMDAKSEEFNRTFANLMVKHIQNGLK